MKGNQKRKRFACVFLFIESTPVCIVMRETRCGFVFAYIKSISQIFVNDNDFVRTIGRLFPEHDECLANALGA